MSKDLWIKAHETFVEEIGREPTPGEMRAAYEAFLSQLIDKADYLAGLRSSSLVNTKLPENNPDAQSH